MQMARHRAGLLAGARGRRRGDKDVRLLVCTEGATHSEGGTVNQDLEYLIVLQAQDLELTRLRTELADLPRRLKAAETELAAAQAGLAECQKQLGAEDKLRRGQESEIASHRAKLDRLRRSLDTATSSQQVGAFQHEISFAEAAIAKLEDEELSSMERTEALEARQKDLAAGLERAKTSLEREREHTAAVKRSHDETIAGIERERGELRAQITPKWLASYDRLAKTRGTAIAEAIGSAVSGKCAACQMGVRPQRWQDLTGREHEDEIFACETCGRLLFWDPRRDTPKPWAAGERFHAAQSAIAGRSPSGSAR